VKERDVDVYVDCNGGLSSGGQIVGVGCDALAQLRVCSLHFRMIAVDVLAG
jgi:hypothetical protein